MKDTLSNLLEDEVKPYNIRHRCFHFSKDIIEFIGETKYERIHYSLFDQLLRSASSIGANMVEGNAGSTNKDFINLCTLA